MSCEHDHELPPFQRLHFDVSPLRLAFGLKLLQQFLCVSQLAFVQPCSSLAHLVP